IPDTEGHSMFATIVKLLGRRLLVAIPILLVVSALLFMILRVLPVDPAAMSLPPNATLEEIEAKRREMGLHLPLFQQYFIWLSQALQAPSGASLPSRKEVAPLLTYSLPSSLALAHLALIVASVTGLPGGLLMSHTRGTPPETALVLGSLVLLSLPEFHW